MAIYKRCQGFELETTETKSRKLTERDSNLGPPDCGVRGADSSATLLPVGIVKSRIVDVVVWYFGVFLLSKAKYIVYLLTRYLYQAENSLEPSWRNPLERN